MKAGYFSTLGARVAEMAAPAAPLPQPERLSLDSGDKSDAAPAPRPEAPPDAPIAVAAQDAPRAEPRADPVQPLHAVETPEPAPAISERTVPPLLQPDTLRLADPVEMTPAEPEAPKAAPEPAQVSDDTKPLRPESPEQVILPDAPTQDTDQPKAPETDDAASEDMSPEDHLALFEAYLDQLSGREPPAPAPAEPTPTPEAPHIEPPQAAPARAAPASQDAPSPAPEPRQPRLEIGEIIVTVADPAPAPTAPHAIPRRRVGPPTRRRFGHGLKPL
jgi:hypothetical protein